MGLFDKLLGKNEENTEDAPDLEELMQSEGDAVSPPVDFYVKRIDLRNEGDGELVIKELMEKNIIILNIKPLAKQEKRLEKIMSKIKEHVKKIGGDIARISLETMETIIITPRNVKIVKSKPKPRRSGTIIS